ncbi:predicted protein [Nematostella vectensis]|uniref:PABS domain-containing protein n=1 Tax=Nematostella vectensis TaxID=45351 RepID=A7RV37_NEMVE|nr:predicted protein [Nematostella vectensis]|eukprot:XP_001636780.1 predicted protein [Nematostella vectensis]
MFVFVGPNSGHWTLRSFKNGHACLDIVTVGAESNNNDWYNNRYEESKAIKESLAKVFATEKSRALPPIIRKGPLNPYLPTVDNLIMQYDIDREIVNVDSKYQNIKILHSNQFGNMLVLNNDINLAESDLSYTKAITGNGKENYKDKTVLILGGGDGGILHHVLKEEPKQVIMAEIDQMVVDLAVKHLRGICGDSMDSLIGPNYEVIIGDCVEIMNKCINKGKLFDYVINDLTAIPITTEARGDQWDFLQLILDLSMKVLSPTGKYFTQGNSFNKLDSLTMFEGQLKKLECPVEFSKETVCVPSYHELWVFYEIWKTNKS